MTEPVRSHVTSGQVVLPSLLDSITYVVVGLNMVIGLDIRCCDLISFNELVFFKHYWVNRMSLSFWTTLFFTVLIVCRLFGALRSCSWVFLLGSLT